MAKSSTIKVLEHCHVSPPLNSAPPTSLPLTFFDIPWLFFSPSQPLFFYEYPYPSSHFTSTTLPKLKNSLSLTLQHFYPLAGNLTMSPFEPCKPEIIYSQADFVSLTIAESDGDLNHLSSNYPRDVNEFYSLVPQLDDKQVLIPLLAIQVTVFPKAGLCIGLAYHHVVADGRTFNNFMKTWASFCSVGDSFSMKSLPSYDRKVIVDAHGLEGIFLKEWWRRKSSKEIVRSSEANVDLSNMVRATFVVGLSDMIRIKTWIIDECNKGNKSLPIHLSPYVLTCAFIWVCLLKVQECFNEKCCMEDPNYFGFIAGGITRLDFPVPASYFGNCVGFGRSMATRKELIGEDGVIVAARAIGSTVKTLDKAIFGGADKWILDWDVLFGSELHVMVAGSPKLDLYETDFGWGRAKKIEEISIDCMRAISLTESRDVEGGIEVGLALPKTKMDAFTTFFTHGLKAFP
uniref:Anthocyanin 5-aromatic acyltransferase n=1 Tax=Fagus sylvatica TaxID=28930 RepID=A0A2N9ILP5_FAGSY